MPIEAKIIDALDEAIRLRMRGAAMPKGMRQAH
jgi:hypothetical protein